MERAGDNLSRKEQSIAFQLGDEAALSFFYREFHPALSLYAFRWLENRCIAEEIASDAFVKIWKMHWKLSDYFAIRSYLYQTVRRDCQRTLKKERKIAEIHKDASRQPRSTDTPFDTLVKAEVYRTIHSALKDLSPGTRKVLAMHYLEGKTTGEIARELQLSPSTIKTQKTKGLQALRKIIIRPMLILSYFFL